jgi:hypothetical protein
LLTRLNKYDIEKSIEDSEALKQVLCPAKRDWTLPEPFTTSLSVRIKIGSSTKYMPGSRVTDLQWEAVQKPPSTTMGGVGREVGRLSCHPFQF